MPTDLNHSYWELKQYFSRFDLIVVGAGLVGLNAALTFRMHHPSARVLVLERGMLPNGASTKNAGFACFGSASELVDDLQRMGATTVWETVEMRWKGLALLRKRLGDKHLRYQPLGGYEVFDQKSEFDFYRSKSEELNRAIFEVLGLKECYSTVNSSRFGFSGVKGLLKNRFEGQLDTGRMMERLLLKTQSAGVVTLNGIAINSLNDLGTHVELDSRFGVFSASRVIVATNGFAGSLLALPEVQPARAQVLVTEQIPGLRIKGAFHFQQGYYYFRDIDGRLLLGGGRNLDPLGETTTVNALHPQIQARLDQLLHELLLPRQAVRVEQRWTGIMGLGPEKKPIVRPVSQNVVAAVRMGGMGVAIGSLVGEQAANLL